MSFDYTNTNGQLVDGGDYSNFPCTINGASTTLGAAMAGVGPCKFGAIQTRMPVWGGSVVSGTGLTLCGVFSAESDYDFVRLGFLNMDSAAHTVTSASVASSSSINDQINPTDATGTANNTLWVPATFNNGGAAGDVPSPGGPTRNATIAAGTHATGAPAAELAATIAFSDWVQSPSLHRTDENATSPQLLFTRVYRANGVICGATDGSGGVDLDAVFAGRSVRSLFTSGDAATSPGTVTGAANTIYQCPQFVQFMSRRRGLSVLAVGDSLFQGFGTASTQNDPFQIAANSLSTPAFPIVVTKASYAGMTSMTFHANAYTFMATRPDVVFLKGESPNDGGPIRPAFITNSSARVFALADYCTRQGAVPVLVTAQPWNYTGTFEAARVAFNAAVRASGYLFLDMDAVLTNGQSPAAIQPQFTNASVSPHYNDAGSAAMAPLVAAILSKIMAQHPR